VSLDGNPERSTRVEEVVEVVGVESGTEERVSVHSSGQRLEVLPILGDDGVRSFFVVEVLVLNDNQSSFGDDENGTNLGSSERIDSHILKLSHNSLKGTSRTHTERLHRVGVQKGDEEHG
jgi:hypothetical protein